MSVAAYFDVTIVGSTLRVKGDLALTCLSRLMACLHTITRKAGYQDVVLDFSQLTSITDSIMPPLAAHLRDLNKNDKIDFEYVPPQRNAIATKIERLGLAHYIDRHTYPVPAPRVADTSLFRFTNQDERERVVDHVLNAALRTTDLGRSQLAALEWAVNEITDNVLTHSRSSIGGFLVCHKLARLNILEFVVADAGIGIAKSLRMADDNEAIERAIQEGVTRNKSTNQGNGLFGTYQLALASAGVFVLRSGYGNLYVDKGANNHFRQERVPFRGTFVVCQIDCDRPDLIEKALVIGGRVHTPAFDFIERKHESTDNSLHIAAKDISRTFGSRDSGAEARRYITNVMNSGEIGVLELDFADVNVISSSYADEVFGKMFVTLGPLRYMKSIKLRNVSPAIEGLIDRAITLRSQTGL